MGEIFHYTTAVGLAGIIQSQAIWYTDYRFLNDPGEVSFGIRKFAEIFPSHSSLLGDYAQFTWDLVHSYEDGGSEDSVFIASFTRKNDLLSLWRGYSGGIGFNIGFNESIISTNLKMIDVLYDEGDQYQALSDFFKSMSRRMSDHPDSTEYAIKVHTPRVLFSLKHRGFDEEQEVRSFLIDKTINAKQLVTARGFKPYIEHKMLNKMGRPWLNEMITSVMVGPGLHNNQLDPVKALLHQAGVKVNPTKSSIPYTANP